MKSVLYSFFWFVLRFAYDVLYPRKVTGLEHLPAEGGVILCLNHCNGNDPFFVATRLPRKRKMYFLGKKEIFDILDGALREMKADGTIDRLIENELRAYIETDAEPKDLPHFEGAQTIRIAVTGDVPPMDFITASGKPAGFNIALLSEIANRAKVNFELVQMDGGARPLALATGKIDASFWTRSVSCVDCNVTWNEAIAHTMITESYLSQPAIDILMVDEK